MKRYVLREYDWIGTAQGSGFSICLSAAQVISLGSAERRWAKGALEWGRDKVRFAGYCGAIKLGDDYFDILPKIAAKDDSSLERSILIKMLQVVFNLQLSAGDETASSLHDTCILDVFIEFFCRTIQEAARRGLPHAYTCHAENLNALRGKLGVSRQIRSNACHPERLSCEFEEFQEDNVLNRVLKAALVIAGRHAGSPGTRVFVKSLLVLFSEVSDVSAVALRWSGLEQDRRYAAWKSALSQARWFLEGECPNLYSGTADSMSILFDMAKLFERFVAIEIKNLLVPMGYSASFQISQWHLLTNESGQERHRIIPDIFLSKDGVPIGVLDTKWKIPSNNNGTTDSAQSDLYQLFAYAKAYHVAEVALIYPGYFDQGSRPEAWIYMDGKTTLHIINADITLLPQGRDVFRKHIIDSGLINLLQRATMGINSSESIIHLPA
jgi:5-methylcytosine-specific restriction enzyme subunit McrC